MTMINEYFEKDKIYKKKHGEKTFLLYQVGSFFEVYGLKDDPSYENIEKFSEICSLAIASKQAYVNKKSLQMAGFRDYLLEKYIEKIYNHGYTIVVYIQKETNGVIERIENGIYSPGTTILDNDQSLSNNISCIWIQKISQTTLSKDKYIFGLSNINIFNGKSNLSEYYESYYHNPTVYDTIDKFLNVYNPVEVIIIHNLNDKIINSVVDFLQLKCKKHYLVDINNNDPTNIFTTQAVNCESQIYQNEIINTYFPSINQEIFKYNVSDKPLSLQSFCFLLNFVRQHNVNLIEKINEPIVEQIDDILICANHSLKQLNIIGDNCDYYDKEGNINGILPILNKCITKMGKRAMNDIILNPISNIQSLNEQYKNIEYFMKQNIHFNDELKQIKDIDKIIVKFKLGRSTPVDIYNLYQSSVIVKNIYNNIKTDKKLLTIFELSKTAKSQNKFIDFIDKCLNLDICSQLNNTHFIKNEDLSYKLIIPGYNKNLDTISNIKYETKEKINTIINYLEGLFKKKDKSDFIQQHYTSNNDLCLLLTKKRGTTLLQLIKTLKPVELSFVSNSNVRHSFKFDPTTLSMKDYNKQKVMLSCDEIDKLLMTLFNTNNEYFLILDDVFNNISKKIYNDYFDYFTFLIESVKKIDILNTKCSLINQYNLCKPKIIKKKDSFVNAKKLRHLLIEIIEKNEIYVPNDISLGNDKNNLGILLFGTNAVGKTSLIKALGICIIMAQSGFYVPCESLEYCPYKYIFTRIIGNDNIFKGLSTFGVEMSELRVILNNCNNNSLILGDELCSGTETDSALSIFNASLEVMSKNKSNFIFATHFHELPHLKTMKHLTNIKCKHLKVQFDNETQQMYYDRKMHDGQGETIYGLEVCKSLNLPDTFIDRCYEIRNEYIDNKDNILLLKTSKYNKNKIKNICEFCNKNIGTEIHHLQYQSDANDNEYIDNSFHKNHTANLCSICNECHNHIHSLNLKFEKRKSINGNYEFILKRQNI
uniref:Muts7 n=1 Tax=Florenciella sp. virus SA2 TaxID=3240092 RepID=A0AB39J9E4_9VIRU